MIYDRVSFWKPIAELADKYQQPLMIASPKLIHGDSNPLGISDGFWQDDEGWKCVGWSMHHDEFYTITLAEADVTHFLIPEGPWTAAELEALESAERGFGVS